MGDANEPSSNSCGETSTDSKTSKKPASEKRKWEPFRIRRKQHNHRHASSDTTPTPDIASSDTEAAHEDCSTTTIECTEPNEESIGSTESIESEPTTCNKASTSSDSEPQNSLAQIVQWTGFFRIMKKGPATPSITLPPSKPKLTRKKSKRFRDDVVPQLCSALNAEISYFRSSWKNFSFLELQEATNNFSHENLIGEGGYAEVYKGQLKSGKFVAIKRLTRGTSEEMTIDLLSELGIIVHVDHPNVAQLIGYGVEGGMHLVLQLSPHGSLSSILYGPKEKLNWQIRFKIAVGAAEGLCYLHEGCQRRIIHKYSSQQSLVMWAKPLIRENKMKELMDSILINAYDPDELHRISATASICIHQSATDRPQMNQVVDILKGNHRGLEMLKECEKEIIPLWTNLEEIFDEKEYNSTNSNDLNHQLEILLEQSNDV